MTSPAARDRQIARIMRQCLAEGARVEIDGLGAFVPGPRRRIQFIPAKRPRVFLAYAVEDIGAVTGLYAALRDNGFDPWLDRKNLLAGQNWPRAIENAIGASDFFLACFSRRSAHKRGAFQTELRFALECASRLPDGEIFLIPLRFDHCDLPASMTRSLQYLNLFPNWDSGIRRLVRAMRHQHAERQRRASLRQA